MNLPSFVQKPTRAKISTLAIFLFAFGVGYFTGVMDNANAFISGAAFAGVFALGDFALEAFFGLLADRREAQTGSTAALPPKKIAKRTDARRRFRQTRKNTGD
jgi:hypothetical protein